jgi:DNA adenine methylase
VETCAGGAWVFFEKSKEASRVEVLNDIDGELVNLYRVLQRRGGRLVRELGRMPYSRRLYNDIWDSRPASEYERAKRFMYVNRVCFGAKMTDRSFGVRMDKPAEVLAKWMQAAPDQIMQRLKGVIFECLDVERLIRVYDRPGTLFFVDPPYLGLTQPYAGTFGEADHARLAAAVRGIAGRAIVTCNDCPTVRKLYAGMTLQAASIKYSLSGALPKTSGELIMTNFRPRSPTAKWPVSERRSRRQNETRNT